MRAAFSYEIHKQMKKNKDIWVIVGDFGYKMWDAVRKDYPDRYINVGASEQAMLGIAIGLALEEKIPIVYTATTFLLYRPFEAIRNYLHYEKIPVKLIGSGRDKDYFHDGISHWAEDDKDIMAVLSNIQSYWPNEINEMPVLINKMLKSNEPWYINLRR
ncbi:MAG TPA: hypothetical protein VND99_04690 [Candidatus Acidoferrales bacterium]|nr:hypothetical protein [Candidatus Acidoferrales bacterium]